MGKIHTAIILLVFAGGIAFHRFVLDKPDVVNNYVTEVKKLKQKGDDNAATVEVEHEINHTVPMSRRLRKALEKEVKK